MKKYLFIALAALGFAACAEKAETNVPANNGEMEKSYVAVTFTADGVTRADQEGDYQVGTTAERTVHSAYIFFFKENGDAFTVANKGSHSGNVNYVDVIEQMDGQPNDANGDAMENVSDIKDTVLVLEKYKGEYPAQVVAVLNWTPTLSSYSLAELKAEVSALGNDANGYVMSNSVYLNYNGETVETVALTSANIAKTEEMAIANPIKIHVERIAAKVEFTADDKGNGVGIFEVGEVEKVDTEKDEMTPVYARIEGFELYNDYEESWLIKKVDENWGLTDEVLSFNWNAPASFRSFWATSLDTKFHENSFAWNTDNTKLDDAQPWVYCGENTRKWSAADDVRTKVIVKATLVEKLDNGKFEPVEIVNWWGKDYVDEITLKTVVANTLVNTYFALDKINSTPEKTIYVGLTPNDIKCVARNPKDKNAYEVYFVIDDASKSKEWYKYENGTYNLIELEKLNGELAAVQPARVYKKGMTYYYTDIKHLGAEKSTAEYGVVRNHVYRVNISDITGFGTPVYNGATGFITPEKPIDINTFVAAEINILSWRVVANDYDLN